MQHAKCKMQNAKCKINVKRKTPNPFRFFGEFEGLFSKEKPLKNYMFDSYNSSTETTPLRLATEVMSAA